MKVGEAMKKKVIMILLLALMIGYHQHIEASSHKQQAAVSYNSGQEKARTAEVIAKRNDAIYDAIAIETDNELLIAVKVRQMHRFHLKAIEKELDKALKRNFNKYTVHVSTDKKIYWEIEKLIKKSDKSSLDKEVRKLIILSNEKT
jgi:hypothetical protein